AVSLHAALVHARAHFGREELDHGDLLDRGLTAIEAARAVDRHRLGSVDIGRAIGECERDALVFGDRLAESDALFRVVSALFQRPAGETDAPACVVDAADRDASEREVEAAMELADECR